MSNECIVEAQVLYDAHFYSGSISRNYHVVFNAIRAALESKEMPVRPHKKALPLFHQHFIKTGIFKREIKDIPKYLKEAHIDVDYKANTNLSEPDAKRALMSARQFYDAVKNYVDAEN